MNKELADKIFYFIKKKRTIEEICTQLEITKETLIGIVMLMKEQGYMCDYINGVLVILKTPIKNEDVYQVPFTAEHIDLCLISDTHLCSKYDRLDILNYIYEKAEKKGIKHILHSGDFTDGLKSGRPEQLYELKEISYQGQVDYCIDRYPKSNSIKTYVIQGNHDDWWYKTTGCEIVKSIAQQREDIIYLGSDCADLKIGKLRIRLFHGLGNAYAKSYKIQKYLDAIPGDEMPHILQTGHIHQSFYMKQDNTHCFQTSCLQDQTPYVRSIGLANDKSCWWVGIDMDHKGNIVRIQQELESFGKKLKR